METVLEPKRVIEIVSGKSDKPLSYSLPSSCSPSEINPRKPSTEPLGHSFVKELFGTVEQARIAISKSIEQAVRARGYDKSDPATSGILDFIDRSCGLGRHSRIMSKTTPGVADILRDPSLISSKVFGRLSCFLHINIDQVVGPKNGEGLSTATRTAVVEQIKKRGQIVRAAEGGVHGEGPSLENQVGLFVALSILSEIDATNGLNSSSNA